MVQANKFPVDHETHQQYKDQAAKSSEKYNEHADWLKKNGCGLSVAFPAPEHHLHANSARRSPQSRSSRKFIVQIK
jgi:hypothetical protein